MAAGALLPAIVAPYLLNRSPSRRIVALAIAPLIFVILIQRAVGRDLVAEVLPVLQKATQPFPIIVGEGLLYIELMEAADAGMRSRLVYLTRPAGSPSPDPTNENLVTRMAASHPDYRVNEPDAFLGGNDDFYELYRPNMSTDMTTPALIAKGVLGSPLDDESGILLFRALPPAEIQQGKAK